MARIKLKTRITFFVFVGTKWKKCGERVSFREKEVCVCFREREKERDVCVCFSKEREREREENRPTLALTLI